MLIWSQTPSNITAALWDIPWASSHSHSARPQPSLIKGEKLVLPAIAWAEIHLSQLKCDFLSFTFLLQHHLHSATASVGILPQNSSVSTVSFSCWGCRFVLVNMHTHLSEHIAFKGTWKPFLEVEKPRNHPLVLSSVATHKHFLPCEWSVISSPTCCSHGECIPRSPRNGKNKNFAKKNRDIWGF